MAQNDKGILRDGSCKGVSYKNVGYAETGYRGGEERRRLDLLQRVSRCWDAMAAFREERKRCKRFTYGDQWSDTMPSMFGSIKEEEYIVSQGNLPLKNNLIRRLVRNVLGVFRNQWAPPRCVARDKNEQRQADVMERLLEYNLERNRMEEMYARTMEEFLISGMAVLRKWFGRKGGETDCWTDFVSPEKFFIDTASRDFRNRDIALIGEIHDLDFEALCASFADDAQDYNRLSAIYSPLRGNGGGFGEMIPGSDEAGRCRVIEAWVREYRPHYLCHDRLTGEYFRIESSLLPEMVEEVNRRRMAETDADWSRCIESRWVMEEEWRYYFLTPDGIVLREGRTPYNHGRHPYTVKAYPFIDGEIHSFVADIIDQQKFTNRLISMYDWILRASAKGVLLFPEGSLPEGVDISDIAEEWSRFNGVIVYRPRVGVPLPQQVHSNASNNGITDLLSIQMKMMEDISGVNNALQGKLDSTSMSGTLYDQQTRNSLTALADLLKSYNDFIMEATAADASNIRQFYSPSLIGAIIGERESFENGENFFNSTFDFSIR
ncbi:MAG: hypothetical protein K2L89_02970, partial [Muribaculaceae bacterium]|nr:hypothetical protein [Muribaculaceae bacterium]